MKCPRCGEPIPSVSCQSCGGEILEKSAFCSWCGKPVKREERLDFSDRIPCGDGTCVGTINENGVCTVCGKPYPGTPT